MRIRPSYYLVLLCLISACSAHGTQKDQAYGNWQVMTSDTGKPTQLCYAGSSPVSSAGMAERKDKPYLIATRRNSGKIEISAHAGYDYAPKSKVDLVINGKHYHLFFRHSIAWAKSDAEDKTILQALKTARSVELYATQEGGATSVDVYSAQGFADALARVKTLCP